MLKADQPAVGGLIRLDQPLGVEPPALDVRAVEGERDPGIGNALLDDRRKLKLVARPGLMGGQRPRGGREREVVELLHLSRLVGDVERQDELADLAGVPEQTRGGCMLGAGIAALSASVAIRIRASRVGQGHDLLVADDRLDFLQAGLVMRQDRRRRRAGLS